MIKALGITETYTKKGVFFDSHDNILKKKINMFAVE